MCLQRSGLRYGLAGLLWSLCALWLCAVAARAEPPPCAEQPDRPSSLWGRAWDFARGEPTDDAVMLGLFTYHTSGNRGTRDTGNLVGIIYRGYTAGTFTNSFDDRCYYAGVARTVWRQRLGDYLEAEVRYQAGLLHGYGDMYPNLFGTTVAALPFVGVSYRRVSADVLVVPSRHPVFSLTFRIRF